MTPPPEVKICGLRRRVDAELAAASGARYGGVILAPGGKRSITPAEAAELFTGIPLLRVGVFVDQSVDAVTGATEAAGLDVVQLHGHETPSEARLLRERLGVAVWKAVRPRTEADLLEAMECFASEVDGLLLDGWSPAAPGGTGTPFQWEILAAHRADVPSGLQIIIAGGLSPANVAEAVSLLRPEVVDVSSGVETSPGVKDPAAIPAFVAAARGAAL